MKTLLNLSLIAILLLSMSNSSCNKEKSETARTVDFNTRFKLGLNVTVAIPEWEKELVLTLNDISDNRCPENVQCIQAGKAEAHFTVLTRDRTEYHFSLCLGDCNRLNEAANNWTIDLNRMSYTIILHEIERDGSNNAILEVNKRETT